MLSYRVDDAEMGEIEQWAQHLDVDRSEFLREAVRRHLAELAADRDVHAYAEQPVTDEEKTFAGIADWGLRRTGLTGPMQRAELWFAATPGGDRPVLILTRDPVADRIGAVVVAD
jgi:hypothetical protein